MCQCLPSAVTTRSSIGRLEKCDEMPIQDDKYQHDPFEVAPNLRVSSTLKVPARATDGDVHPVVAAQTEKFIHYVC